MTSFRRVVHACPLRLGILAPRPVDAQQPLIAARTRRNYIADDEVSWDYVPDARDEIARMAYADTVVFAKGKPRSVSTVYMSVRYREHADSTFTIRKGQHVRWYPRSSANDFDFHAPRWHDNAVILNRVRTDAAQLSMMQTATGDMVPDDVGTCLFHCRVRFHNEEAMAVRYQVTP